MLSCRFVNRGATSRCPLDDLSVIIIFFSFTRDGYVAHKGNIYIKNDPLSCFHKRGRKSRCRTKLFFCLCSNLNCQLFPNSILFISLFVVWLIWFYYRKFLEMTCNFHEIIFKKIRCPCCILGSVF